MTDAPITSVPPQSPHRARFESIGAALPERRVTTSELMSRVRLRGRVNLERLTGIRERRVCAEGEDSLTLAAAAAEECLRHSSYAAGDLEMLICASISKFADGLEQVFEPALALLVRDAIGAHRAVAFDVGNACAGVMTGVYILTDFIARGVISRGMVVSGEYITSLSENAVPTVRSLLSRQLASLTVGDCGAAVIVERAPDDGSGALTTSGFVTVAQYSGLCIGTPCERGPGGEMVTQARKLHDAGVAASEPVLTQLLRDWPVDPAEIDWVIPHQTSSRAIRAGQVTLSRHFGARPRNVVVNVEEYGNTASTSHFLALYGHLREGRFRSGDNILLIALASGLVMGCVAFTMDHLADRYG